MKLRGMIIVALCVLALSACKSEGEKLRDVLHKTVQNYKLPSATPIGNIVDAGTDGDGIYINLKLKDEYAQVVKESEYAVIPKFGAMGFLSEIVKAMPVSETALSESGVWIRYSYLSNEGDTVKTMLVENSHLIEALKRLNDANGEPLYEKDFYMWYIVDNTKPMLPIDFGNGVVYSDISVNGDAIVYEYVLNGANKEAITGEMLSTSKKMLKQELVEMYSYTQYMIEDLSKLGVSFKYTYKNDVGEHLFEIDITAQEIADGIKILL